VSPEIDRRTFIRRSLLASASAAATAQVGLTRAAAGDTGAKPPPAPGSPGSGEGIPQGKIAGLSVSRLVLGGNLLTHYTHSRDLQYVYNLCAHYNTEEKTLETLALAEQHGINTLVVHTVPRVLDILKKYRHERGGKIQWIICPTTPVEDDLAAYAKQVRELVEDGTEAIYLWGVAADPLVSHGQMDLVMRIVSMVKEYGLPSGVAAHDLNVIIECEKNKVPADFYIKTFHHHRYPSAPRPDQLTAPNSEVPGYWCRNPEEVINFMKDVEKPWIAFKVMAAGAIAPKDAFQYVFESGADHILAGMFDFEIAEDVGIAKSALANVNRTRPWRS
jgi:hypothetical protein